MPVVHTSTIKRARQAEKRRARNHAILHRTKTVVKKFQTAVQKHETQSASVLLREATSTLHKAAAKGALHRNTASRRIAQLMTRFNALNAQ